MSLVMLLMLAVGAVVALGLITWAIVSLSKKSDF